VTANRVLRRIESEGWAERFADRRLRITGNAAHLIRLQYQNDFPVVISLVAPAPCRPGFEAEAASLTEGFAEVFPNCSVRQLYLDANASSEEVMQLFERDSRMNCEIGYVLAGMPDRVKRLFGDASMPCVVLGYVEPELNLPCVYEDLTEVGRLAGQLLCPLGRVVALCGGELVGAEAKLTDGFRQVAHQLGRQEVSASEFYRPLRGPAEVYRKTIDSLLAAPDRPSGILAIYPDYALATVQVAAQRGIRMPQDLQVVGLHHHPSYLFTYPTITSIGPTLLESVGRRCAELLADSMAERPSNRRREVLVSTLIERDSTRADVRQNQTAG
jgi:DNA-binding LacI/PurR family transcriptional regulator